MALNRKVPGFPFPRAYAKKNGQICHNKGLGGLSAHEPPNTLPISGRWRQIAFTITAWAVWLGKTEDSWGASLRFSCADRISQ